MMALCEVVDHASVEKFDWGYVAPEEWTVCTRFFLVFDGPARDVTINEHLCQDIRLCMERLNVGCAGHTETEAAKPVDVGSTGTEAAKLADVGGSLPTKTKSRKTTKATSSKSK